MEQNDVIAPTTSQAQPSAPISPFLSRASDVFASPASLYNEVAVSPVQTTSWLVPYVSSIVVAMVFSLALFSNPTLRDQMLQPRLAELQKSVQEGKMTQDQYDRATGMMSSGPMFLSIAIFGSLFSVTVAIFGIPLLLWLVAKLALKASAGYKKMLEVYGLASLIGVAGAIVTLLTMHLFDSARAVPGLGMLVMNDFDHDNTLHRLLLAIGVFSVWQAVVVGIGLGKVSGRPTGAGIGLAMALWLCWVVLSSVFGWGMG